MKSSSKSSIRSSTKTSVSQTPRLNIKSTVSHAGLEGAKRLRKARKIISVLGNYADLGHSDVLDIGTGSGHIASELGAISRNTVSIDLHDERVEKQGYRFVKVKDERIPFKDNSFDVVISNHTIEHIPHQKLHLSEAHRVLRKGGLLYLATPNRFWIMDPHYRLPFISFFPRPLSAFYLWMIRRKRWDIRPLSYFKIMRMSRKMFKVKNMTPEVVKHPEKYRLDGFGRMMKLFRRMPLWMIRCMNPLLPSYILMMRKP